jgi:thimet oligopeptidase
MSEISIAFSQNLNEDTTKLHFSKEELAGLPEDFFEGLSKTNDGKYIVSLKYPELFPILEQCTVESTRRAMEFANSSKCVAKNVPLMQEMLTLRQGKPLSTLAYFL